MQQVLDLMCSLGVGEKIIYNHFSRYKPKKATISLQFYNEINKNLRYQPVLLHSAGLYILGYIAGNCFVELDLTTHTNPVWEE